MSKECHACKGTRKLKWDMSEGSKPHVVYVDCPFCKEGEQGMKEKLTKEEWLRRCRNWIPAYDGSGQMIALVEAQWGAIEADREAIRAEAREEFRDVSTLRGVSSEMVRYALGGLNAMPGTTLYMRRPPKKRAMTREEKIGKLKEHLAMQHAWLPDKLKDEETTDDLCRAFEIPTEVDE